MNIAHRSLAGHARLFKAGKAFTVPTPGNTADAAHLPGPTDVGWVDLGHLDLKVKPTVTTDEIKGAPAGSGKVVLLDVVETSRVLVHVLHLHELGDLQFELAFGVDLSDVAPGGTYTPNSAKAAKGWLEVTEMDQDNNVINVHTGWVYLKPPSELDHAEKHVECDVEASVLYSTLNQGVFGVAA
jgi:hypothetical protein